MHLSSSLLALLLPAATQASLQIVPGASWTASDGEHLNAHGAGIIRVNDTFYLIGEDKAQGSAFQNINCYSSRDLVQWKFEGRLLSRQGSGDLGPNRIVERPKVIYNDRTRQYVMWMHIDSSDYKDARVGVAVGDQVCGSYRYLRSFRPLGFQSRDMGLFKDDDGTAYLLTEDRQNGLRINKLTADYLDVAEATYKWSEKIESPAMIKLNGRYYIFGSHLTGWDPNDNVYSTSTSLSSGWSSWQTFADKGSNTYHSQTTYILQYPGSPSNLMYLGDRWRPGNLHQSSYIWLPLTIEGTKVTLKNRGSWIPNLNPPTGGASTTWAAAPAATTYNALSSSNARLSGAAKQVTCNNCANKKAAGYIGGPNNGVLTFYNINFSGSGSSNSQEELTTIWFRYHNGDSQARYASLVVNGREIPGRVAFIGTRGEVQSSVVHVPLRRGGGNEIVVRGWNGGWGPDVEALIVPQQ